MLLRPRTALFICFLRWLSHQAAADMSRMLVGCNGGSVDCDVDSDGHGNANCGGIDCDDNDPTVFPNNVEVCGDNKDNNCDGQIDEGCLEEEGYCVRNKIGTACQNDVECGGICFQGYKAGSECMDDIDCPPNSGTNQGFCRFAARACDSSPAAIPVPVPMPLPVPVPIPVPVPAPVPVPKPAPIPVPVPVPVPVPKPAPVPIPVPVPVPAPVPVPVPAPLPVPVPVPAPKPAPVPIPVPAPVPAPVPVPVPAPLPVPAPFPVPVPVPAPVPIPAPAPIPVPVPVPAPVPVPNPVPVPVPVPAPVPAPVPVTYFPGDLTGGYRADLGLTLSKGLLGRRLTRGGSRVALANGTNSTQTFHAKADGAGVIAKTDGNGWYYVSNSEVGSSGGGVGAIEFNAAGEVVGYRRILTGTTWNCGGGRTYWGTWVTCEENGGSGRLYEVDPNTGFTQQIRAVDVGGNWESFAYDDQDPDVPARFYITEDWSYGALVRYTPAPAAFTTGNNYNILNTAGGKHEFLVFHANGTYSWSTSRSVGETSAETYYPNTEGIDIFNRQMFFTSKVTKTLVQVDLAGNTYSITSTLSGQFNMQPDQLGRILKSSGGNNDVLYFCEDGGSDSDIHGRDATGKYFTIVEGTDYTTETTGLTFSPDAMFMYVSYQGPSSIFAFWREDGLPFSGVIAGTKYH